MAQFDDPVAAYLMQNAQRKNPGGFFGMQVTPYMTPQDKQALRYQELLAGLQDKGDFITAGMMEGGAFLGQMANKLMGRGGGQQAPQDPQQVMMMAYNTALKNGADEFSARDAALKVGMEAGYAPAFEAYAKLNDERRKDADTTGDNNRAQAQDELDAKDKTWEKIGETGEYIIQKNGLGKIQVERKGALVNNNINTGSPQQTGKEFTTYFFEKELPRAEEVGAQGDNMERLGTRIAGLVDKTPWSGPLAPAGKAVADVISQLSGGTVAADAIGNYEDLNASGFQVAVSQAADLKPISNVDIEMIKNASPGLTKTAGGNRALSAALQAVGKAKKDYRDATREWVSMAQKSGKGVYDQIDGQTYYEFLQERLGKKSYLSDEQRKLFGAQEKPRVRIPLKPVG